MNDDDASAKSADAANAKPKLFELFEHKAASTPSFESAVFDDLKPKRRHNQFRQYRKRARNRPIDEPPPHTLLESLSAQELGDEQPHAHFVASLYITSCKEQGRAELRCAPFAEALRCLIAGRVRIERTRCGLFAAYTKSIDVENTLKLPLKKIFGKPIEVVKFGTGEVGYRRQVLVRNVPWCIPDLEIMQALKLQGIRSEKVRRIGSYLEVELTNALDRYRLIQEGLNFFNRATFDTLLDSNCDSRCLEDIVQCYKCQGFWHTSTHCREQTKCVRCGGQHDLDHCPRSRNNPMCCHCGGPHHAAAKECPVRLKHIRSSYINFTLSRTKPNGEVSHVY